MTSNETAPIIVALPDKGIKVDATTVAKPFREEIKKKIQEFKEDGIGTNHKIRDES